MYIADSYPSIRLEHCDHDIVRLAESSSIVQSCAAGGSDGRPNVSVPRVGLWSSGCSGFICGSGRYI